jgi:hypothetical protein
MLTYRHAPANALHHSTCCSCSKSCSNAGSGSAARQQQRLRTGGCSCHCTEAGAREPRHMFAIRCNYTPTHSRQKPRSSTSSTYTPTVESGNRMRELTCPCCCFWLLLLLAPAVPGRPGPDCCGCCCAPELAAVLSCCWSACCFAMCSLSLLFCLNTRSQWEHFSSWPRLSMMAGPLAPPPPPELHAQQHAAMFGRSGCVHDDEGAPIAWQLTVRPSRQKLVEPQVVQWHLVHPANCWATRNA